MKMVLHGLLKVAGVQKEPRDSWRRGQTLGPRDPKNFLPGAQYQNLDNFH